MQTDQFQLHAEIENRHWWFCGRRRIVRRLLAEIAAPHSGRRIVDVGCGTGANIASLTEAYDCHGIDPSAEGIRLARERFPAVQFTCGLAPEAFGPAEREADVLLAMDVMEHVADDFLFASSLLAALKPGGHLLVTVPADETLWSPHDVNFGHYRRYTRARLERVWQGLPVTPLLVSHSMARLLPVVRAVRAVNRRRGRAAGAAGTDFALPPAWINRGLENTFAGEADRLVAAMRDPWRAYSRGVSLVAILRRECGAIESRSRPADVPADLHDPAAPAATAGRNGRHA
jgi:2-polyprenyl-3-methyl-5-hydroxy-6-metoxy-1,4-benzoquinol methylase